MMAFYARLDERMRTAEALQAAQAETRAQFPRPFYWVTFVLTGDPGTTRGGAGCRSPLAARQLGGLDVVAICRGSRCESGADAQL